MQKFGTFLGIVFIILFNLWGLALTWCAFFGGSVWVIFGTIDFQGGSFIRGLLFLFIGEPILFTVAYWIGMLIMFPFAYWAETHKQNTLE